MNSLPPNQKKKEGRPEPFWLDCRIIIVENDSHRTCESKVNTRSRKFLLHLFSFFFLPVQRKSPKKKKDTSLTAYLNACLNWSAAGGSPLKENEFRKKYRRKTHHWLHFDKSEWRWRALLHHTFYFFYDIFFFSAFYARFLFPCFVRAFNKRRGECLIRFARLSLPMRKSKTDLKRFNRCTEQVPRQKISCAI